MRKIEMITLFNANCLAMSNNSLTHSLTPLVLQSETKRVRTLNIS